MIMNRDDEMEDANEEGILWKKFRDQIHSTISSITKDITPNDQKLLLKIEALSECLNSTWDWCASYTSNTNERYESLQNKNENLLNEIESSNQKIANLGTLLKQTEMELSETKQVYQDTKIMLQQLQSDYEYLDIERQRVNDQCNEMELDFSTKNKLLKSEYNETKQIINEIQNKLNQKENECNQLTNKLINEKKDHNITKAKLKQLNHDKFELQISQMESPLSSTKSINYYNNNKILMKKSKSIDALGTIIPTIDTNNDSVKNSGKQNTTTPLNTSNDNIKPNLNNYVSISTYDVSNNNKNNNETNNNNNNNKINTNVISNNKMQQNKNLNKNDNNTKNNRNRRMSLNLDVDYAMKIKHAASASITPFASNNHQLSAKSGNGNGFNNVNTPSVHAASVTMFRTPTNQKQMRNDDNDELDDESIATDLHSELLMRQQQNQPYMDVSNLKIITQSSVESIKELMQEQKKELNETIVELATSRNSQESLASAVLLDKIDKLFHDSIDQLQLSIEKIHQNHVQTLNVLNQQHIQEQQLHENHQHTLNTAITIINETCASMSSINQKNLNKTLFLATGSVAITVGSILWQLYRNRKKAM